MKPRSIVVIAFVSALCLLSSPVLAQESETLLTGDNTFDSMWSLELKTNSVKNELGTLIGIYWGAVLNRTMIFGIGGVANLGHKITNYGGLQLLAQYMPEPEKLIHFGGQIAVVFAGVKDYESPKTNLFDNFANTSGANFTFIEPRVNAELNMTKSEKIVLGVSYCHAFGLNAQSRFVAASKVTNKDLSGVNITIGLKFGEY